jgi:hypothetical protein
LVEKLLAALSPRSLSTARYLSRLFIALLSAAMAAGVVLAGMRCGMRIDIPAFKP